MDLAPSIIGTRSRARLEKTESLRQEVFRNPDLVLKIVDKLPASEDCIALMIADRQTQPIARARAEAMWQAKNFDRYFTAVCDYPYRVDNPPRPAHAPFTPVEVPHGDAQWLQRSQQQWREGALDEVGLSAPQAKLGASIISGDRAAIAAHLNPLLDRTAQANARAHEVEDETLEALYEAELEYVQHALRTHSPAALDFILNSPKIDVAEHVISHGSTLHEAAWVKNSDAVKKLAALRLQLGRDPHELEDDWEQADLNINEPVVESRISLLHIAARSNDPELVKTALEIPGADVLEVSTHRLTPLHYALKTGDLPTIRAFRAKLGQVPVDEALYASSFVVTAMHSRGDVGAVMREALAIPGIDPNFRGNGLLSPLQIAVKDNRVEALRALLADPRVNQDVRFLPLNQSLLHKAAEKNNEAALSILLKLEDFDRPPLKLNATDMLGRTPLDTSIFADAVGAARMLCRVPGIDINGARTDEFSPLALVIRMRQTAILRALIEHPECDVLRLDSEGLSCLQRAVVTGYHEGVDLLLARGLNDGTNLSRVPRNIANDRGFTALHQALAMRELRIFDRLLADPETIISAPNPQDGATPLHYACGLDNEHFVNAWLLRAKQKNCLETMNLRDTLGRTALQCAISSENRGAVRALLSHPELQIEGRDRDGCTPLQLAWKKKDDVIIGLLSNDARVLNNEKVMATALAEGRSGSTLRPASAAVEPPTGSSNDAWITSVLRDEPLKSSPTPSP